MKREKIIKLAIMFTVIIFTMGAGAGSYHQYLILKPIQKSKKEIYRWEQLAFREKEEEKEEEPEVIYRENNRYGDPVAVESTSYCENENKTADGSSVRIGIAAARKEWIGKTVILYENNNGKIGDMLGIWEIKDTGSEYRIKAGTCIDIWLPTEKEAREWGRKQVYMQLIDAKG